MQIVSLPATLGQRNGEARDSRRRYDNLDYDYDYDYDYDNDNDNDNDRDPTDEALL